MCLRRVPQTPSRYASHANVSNCARLAAVERPTKRARPWREDQPHPRCRASTDPYSCLLATIYAALQMALHWPSLATVSRACYPYNLTPSQSWRGLLLVPKTRQTGPGHILLCLLSLAVNPFLEYRCLMIHPLSPYLCLLCEGARIRACRTCRPFVTLLLDAFDRP